MTNLRAFSVISARLSTMALGFVVPLIDTSDFSTKTTIFMIFFLWTLWALALLSVLIPSSISLTALRLSVPTFASITAIAVAGSTSPTATIVSLALCVLCLVLISNADVGNFFVQASAYGDEKRFLLRCPGVMIIVQVLAWAGWMIIAISAAVFFISGTWIVAIALSILACVLAIILAPRFHRFSRRWLVTVPAGLVIHDQVILEETAMFMKGSIATFRICPAGQISESADLSGGCSTNGLVIAFTDFTTVVLASTAKTPGGKALHIKSLRVCPSRLVIAVNVLRGSSLGA